MLLATLLEHQARINEALALTYGGDFRLHLRIRLCNATLKQRTEKAAGTAGECPPVSSTAQVSALDSRCVSQLQTMVATPEITRGAA